MSQLEVWKKQFDPFTEWSPGRGLDRFFEDFYTSPVRKKSDFSPKVHVEENKLAYLLKFDMPGLSKDQIKIDLHEKTLTVSGERHEEKKTADKEDSKLHMSEIYFGSFSRSFQFPESVDAEKTEAKFENGVLTLSLPKKEQTQKRQISIK